jgi:sigma-E factor negative regulatory protein RseB
MTLRALRLSTLSVMTLLVSAPLWAADESARDWLAKMTRAVRNLDYEGTFVYQHESRIDTLRIVHKIVDGMPHERLVSLSGAAHEIVRDAREVRRYYPDENAIVVEQRRADNQNFPSILPERLQDLEENYTILLGKAGRVAGRAAQQVLIRPRDVYRYGYHLWSDRESGLLLKADLVDDKDRVLEQFVFTQISVGGNIPLTALQPQTANAGMVTHRDNRELSTDVEPHWTVTKLPKGFRLLMQIRREVPLRKKLVEHLVYSDGLAAVSVFVEKFDAADDKSRIQGASRMGAVNAYGTQIDQHHVTAMGEVPSATVSLIGGSVARRQ